MATPATARRSELPTGKLQAELEAHHSPMRAAHQSTSRASTPRPSISPLSTASKPNRSPEATRDTLQAAQAVIQEPEVEDTADHDVAETGELEDDRSSSLSDPDDDQDEEEDANGAIDDLADGAQLQAQKSLEIDSEAETERLDQTPQKLRKHADSIGLTPSKLSQTAVVEDELSEPPSPLPVDTGAASSTTTVATGGTKRKRSDTAESPLTSADSDLEESPRKRSHELPAETIDPTAEAVLEEDLVEEAVVDATEVTPAPEEIQSTPAPAALLKVVKGKKGKPRGRKAKEHVTESEADVPEETGVGAQPTVDAVAKTQEEKQQKARASTMFDDVAKQFTAFRDKLYTERLATMNVELNLLQQADCQHPEYLRQVACVNARRDKQMREAQAYYHYRLTSIRQRTLGDRAQLQSQYHQHIRELREDVMYKLGEDWYNIQKERRQQHQDQDERYIFKFPAKRSAQLRQQAKYNQEISVLSGVAKYVGFPAAPDIKGAEGDGLEDDLKAMKISKRVQQSAANAQPFYQRLPTVPTPNERLAHDQFIEQNAWAQPQRPIHNHGTPNLTHTPDWVDQPGQQGTARNLIRNLSGGIPRNGSPYTTPMPQKRQAQEQSSSGTVPIPSDGAEPPSSVLAAPPTSDRIHALHHASTPQATPLHISKHRHQANGERELTGYRNISSISHVSGASTIDAPPDSAEKEREREREREREHLPTKTLPGLLSEVSAPQQGPGPSQLRAHGNYPTHRNGHGRGVFVNLGFRPQEGAFGTPAPLSGSGGGPQ